MVKPPGFFRLPIGDQSLSAVADVVLPWPMKVINLLIWLVNPTLYGGKKTVKCPAKL